MKRILFFGYLFILFVSVLCFLPEAQAGSTSYYVAPNSSGNSCTRQSPCSLDTGLSKASSGDEVVLLDGVYGQKTTRKITKNGITIRALNRHQAVIAATAKYVGRIWHITGDNLVIRGIRFESRNFVWSSTSAMSENPVGNAGVRFKDAVSVIFEDNFLIDANIEVNSGTHNTILRHNLLQWTNGVNGYSEAFYIRADNMEISKLQIYGNITNGHSSNAMKLHGNQGDIHHNIFAGQTGSNNFSNDGCINFAGIRTRFHNNIIRNSKCGTAAIDYLSPWSDNLIYQNVFYNDTNMRAFTWFYNVSSGPYEKTRIFNNTFCGLSTYAIQTRGGSTVPIPSGLEITNNPGFPGGTSQSACDAEVNRILNEMKNLPGAPGGAPQPSQQFHAPLLNFTQK